MEYGVLGQNGTMGQNGTGQNGTMPWSVLPHAHSTHENFSDESG